MQSTLGHRIAQQRFLDHFQGLTRLPDALSLDLRGQRHQQGAQYQSHDDDHDRELDERKSAQTLRRRFHDSAIASDSVTRSSVVGEIRP